MDDSKILPVSCRPLLRVGWAIRCIDGPHEGEWFGGPIRGWGHRTIWVYRSRRGAERAMEEMDRDMTDIAQIVPVSEGMDYC